MANRNKKTKRFIRSVSFLCIIVGAILVVTAHEFANIPQKRTIWSFQSVDTMKYSRDASKDPAIFEQIPKIMTEVAYLHPTHVAIGTPYDDEFYPVLFTWVNQARKENLNVWFRGNFSAWEGWFGYTRMTDIQNDHALVKAFIINHPELFRDGDIFTPVPEAENGVIGDPRGSEEKARIYNQFLIDSYNNCVAAFQQIKKNVTCGYFSMNGGVAKDVLTKETVKAIGNVITIDHYVESPEQFASDIDYLHTSFGANIVLGELGAPIPDINGDMNENQQATFVDSLLNVLYKKQRFITGLNYWVVKGGSTALYNDDGTKRQVTNTIIKYFAPTSITGRVINSLGFSIKNAVVSTNDGSQAVATDNNGNFSLFFPQGSQTTFKVEATGYSTLTHNAIIPAQQTVVITPVRMGIFYRVALFFHNLFQSK